MSPCHKTTSLWTVLQIMECTEMPWVHVYWQPVFRHRSKSCTEGSRDFPWALLVYCVPYLLLRQWKRHCCSHLPLLQGSQRQEKRSDGPKASGVGGWTSHTLQPLLVSSRHTVADRHREESGSIHSSENSVPTTVHLFKASRPRGIQ